MTFAKVKLYLDAIADASGGIGGSPHRKFWNVPYQSFIDGDVPGESRCTFGFRLPDRVGQALPAELLVGAYVCVAESPEPKGVHPERQ